MVDRPLHAHIKNPVILTISDGKNDFHSGCKVIDINFPNITNPEVGLGLGYTLYTTSSLQIISIPHWQYEAAYLMFLCVVRFVCSIYHKIWYIHEGY